MLNKPLQILADRLSGARERKCSAASRPQSALTRRPCDLAAVILEVLHCVECDKSQKECHRLDPRLWTKVPPPAAKNQIPLERQLLVCLWAPIETEHLTTGH